MIHLNPLGNRLFSLAQQARELEEIVNEAHPSLVRYRDVLGEAERGAARVSTSVRQSKNSVKGFADALESDAGRVTTAASSIQEAITTSQRAAEGLRSSARAASEESRKGFESASQTARSAELEISKSSTRIAQEASSAAAAVESTLGEAQERTRRVADDTLAELRRLINDLHTDAADLGDVIAFLERTSGNAAKQLLAMIRLAREGKISLAELARYVEGLERALPGFNDLEDLANAVLREFQEGDIQ